METIYSRLVAGPLRISTASINLVFVILLNIDWPRQISERGERNVELCFRAFLWLPVPQWLPDEPPPPLWNCDANCQAAVRLFTSTDISVNWAYGIYAAPSVAIRFGGACGYGYGLIGAIELKSFAATWYTYTASTLCILVSVSVSIRLTDHLIALLLVRLNDWSMGQLSARISLEFAWISALERGVCLLIDK